MDRIQIPGTPLAVFPLCLGTAEMGATVSETDALALLDAYVERGGNFLDTALVYSDWLPGERSRSEKLIGAWLKARRHRARLVLATKGGHPPLNDMRAGRLGRADLEADLNASLTHLQTDVIDLYWLHRDDVRRPVEEIVEVLNDQVQAGKIRAFGCSNWQVHRLRAANDYAAAHGRQGFAADQVLWNLAVVDRGAMGDPSLVAMDAELHRYHRQTSLACLPYSSTANGLFHKLAHRRFPLLPANYPKMYAGPENRRRYVRARELAQRQGLSLTQVVLGYLLSQPFVTIPVIGPRKTGQLLDSLTAASVRLAPDDLAFLEGRAALQ